MSTVLRPLLFPMLYLLFPAVVWGQAGAAEYHIRRQAAAEKAADGVILLHANSGMKRWEEAGFHQDPNFYYFTGLRNAQGEILAIDGAAKESWLFVSPKSGGGSDPPGFDAVAPPPGTSSESALGIEHVVPWGDFIAWMDARRSTNPKAAFYIDSGGQTGRQMGDGGNPEGLAPAFNSYLLWKNAVHSRWPDLVIRNGFSMLDEIRQVKSGAEIAALRRAAAITAEGFWAAATAIAPGRTERQIEGEVVRSCLAAGSNGPSLWPWIRSGPNSLGSALFAALLSTDNFNRTMKPGEVVRVDVGCDSDQYKGDLGRTIPVSGRFEAGQREALDLLTGAYLAGVETMKEGTTAKDVVQAGVAYTTEHRAQLKTDAGQRAAQQMIANGIWPLHGLGLDMADGFPKTLRTGNVICFEPGVELDGEMLFVEDTILITGSGHEILNPPLPYWAADIERALAKRRK